VLASLAVSDVTAALLTAVDAVEAELPALAEQLADPGRQRGAAADQAAAQFLHAFIALLREALAGGGDQRELVMQTAVPALVAGGRSSLDLLDGHVAFFTALSPRLLAEVPDGQRAEAGRWIARYAAGYTREVVERARDEEAT
jgi:hypothetical protein